MYPTLKKWRGLGRVFFLQDFSLELEVSSSKIAIYTFPAPLRSFTVDENKIGLVVIEILSYRQTKKDILLLLYNNFDFKYIVNYHIYEIFKDFSNNYEIATPKYYKNPYARF